MQVFCCPPYGTAKCASEQADLIAAIPPAAHAMLFCCEPVLVCKITGRQDSNKNAHA